ncbi:uncharacterized protein [Nicotiana sylvestris]|uniref:uncharacterized protein n=1 Tax=Nicotiana sylvestris TaxID=4096 RepID=UPI00388CA51F
MYVDPLHIQVRDQHAYCNAVQEEVDGEPWFYDIKEYLKMGIYPKQATGDQKRVIRRLSNGFFLIGGVLYRRTPDLGLLRYIDAGQATTVMAEILKSVTHRKAEGYNWNPRQETIKIPSTGKQKVATRGPSTSSSA